MAVTEICEMGLEERPSMIHMCSVYTISFFSLMAEIVFTAAELSDISSLNEYLKGDIHILNS